MGLFDRNPEGGALVSPMSQSSSGGGGGGGASTALDNLVAPNINEDLKFQAGKTVVLRNDTFLKARNAADDTDLDLFKLSSSDVLEVWADSFGIQSVNGLRMYGHTIHMGDGIDSPSGLEIRSADRVGGPPTGGLTVRTGEKTGSGNTGGFTKITGAAAAGNSGGFDYQTGSASGNTGGFQFITGDAGSNSGGFQFIAGAATSRGFADFGVRATRLKPAEVNVSTQQLQFQDVDASNFVAFKAPDVINTDLVLVLPAADGVNGDVLTTDGAGNLSFASVSGANDTLSNLSAPTAVNENLFMAATKSVIVKNNVAFKSRNQADTADVDLIYLNTSNNIIIGNGTDAYFQLNRATSAISFVSLGSAPETDFNAGMLHLFGAGTGTPLLLKFWDDDFSDYVSLRAPTSMTATVEFVLPSADGSVGHVLTTDGAGNLSFAAVSGGATTALDNLASVAINSDLLPDGDGNRNNGSLTKPWNDIYAYQIRSSFGLQLLPADGSINILAPGNDSGNVINIHTGNATGSNSSPEVSTFTGNSVDGPSGNNSIRSGNASGAGNSGNVDLSPGSVNTGVQGKSVLNGRAVAIGAQSASDPASPTAGDLYYNTTANKLKFYNGTTWETVTST